MTPIAWLTLVAYTVVLLLCAKAIGSYLAAVFEGERTFLHPVMRPVEVAIYRIAGIDERREQDWRRYTVTILALSVVCFLLVYTIFRLQDHLPLNPQALPALSPSLAFNTTVSFLTNTEWQSYSGEATMSYFSQMVGLTFLDFISPAIGIAVLVAVIRGVSRHEGTTLGNFWVDATRSILYLWLPASFVLAILLMSQGIIQNFSAYKEVTTLEGAKQLLAQGPAASMVAIKQLGTNGGGFFNVNSAHPFENPTQWTNLVELFEILVIPVALVYMYGKMVGSTRHGWMIISAMTSLFLFGAIVAMTAEQGGNPNVADAGVAVRATGDQPGGNMEGKEVRFGIGTSALWGVAVTTSGNGSVNSMHDSWTPIAGLVPLANMMTDEVIFGGVGSGMFMMVGFILLTVFIAGLMVGRTPEYLGKKLGAREVKAVATILLVLAALILFGSGLASVIDSGTVGLGNSGPHGLSEILYAFSSAAGNNGSAFGGLTANTDFYNTALGVTIIFGRYVIVIGMLVVAGTLVPKRRVAPSLGTFPTDGKLFAGFLVGVVVIVGLLTFFPALALGPIVEQLLVHAGQLF